MRYSCNCRRTPLRLQPPPRKQYANRQLSSLLDLPKKGRQAFQPRRRKHPGAPTSPPRRLRRQPRPRRVARDHRSATPRSTPRNSLLPILIAASFFITCANSRTPLLNLLRQSALIERAALSGRRRHKAAHANTIGNNEGAGDSGARTQLPYRPLSPIWSLSNQGRFRLRACSKLPSSARRLPRRRSGFGARPLDSLCFRISHQDGRGSCLKTRCTTLVPMPSFRPILRMPSPLALSSSMRASTDGLTRRRPNLVPFALARASPAFTRSLMIPRSNSANTPSI